MLFSSLNYNGSDAFDVTVKALLHGYRAKAKGEHEKEVPATVRVINLIVIGPSEATARNFVEQTLRDNTPSNILPLGYRSNHHEFLNTFVQGHVIVMREVETMNARYFADIAKIIRNIGSLPHNSNDSLHFHFPHAGIECDIRGALYEQWLNGLHSRYPSFEFHGVRFHTLADEIEMCGYRQVEIPKDAIRLNLRHLLPVIQGTTSIQPCERTVALDNSLVGQYRIWQVLNQLSENTKRRIIIPDEVLKFLFHLEHDQFKEIGPCYCKEASDERIVPALKYVNEL